MTAALFLVLGVLPFIASLWGRGLIWKLLALLASIVALAGIFVLPIDPLSVAIAGVAWVIGLVFAGIARNRKERYLLTRNQP